MVGAVKVQMSHLLIIEQEAPLRAGLLVPLLLQYVCRILDAPSDSEVGHRDHQIC